MISNESHLNNNQIQPENKAQTKIEKVQVYPADPTANSEDCCVICLNILGKGCLLGHSTGKKQHQFHPLCLLYMYPSVPSKIENIVELKCPICRKKLENQLAGDQETTTRLKEAIEANNLEKVLEILSHYAFSKDVINDVLQQAAAQNSLDILRILNGLRQDPKDGRNQAVDRAIARGQVGVVEILLDSNREDKLEIHPDVIGAGLVSAINDKQTEIIKILLTHAKKVSSDYRSMAVMCATKQQNLPLVKQLLSSGPILSDAGGWAFNTAFTKNNLEIMSLLMEQPELISDQIKEEVLKTARQEKNVAAIKTLIAGGVEPTEADFKMISETEVVRSKLLNENDREKLLESLKNVNLHVLKEPQEETKERPQKKGLLSQLLVPKKN